MGVRSMTVRRFEEIRRRLSEGRGLREIARALGCSRDTVREVRDGLRVSPDAPKALRTDEPLMLRLSPAQCMTATQNFRYDQMIGRGLRGPRFGGTDTCVIIDLEDKYRSECPMLGYQQFRDLWRQTIRNQQRSTPRLA
jgi:hypothetical protein